MAGPLTLRCAEGNGRPWTLKQVQGDDDGNVAFRSPAATSRKSAAPLDSALPRPNLSASNIPSTKGCRDDHCDRRQAAPGHAGEGDRQRPRTGERERTTAE